MRFQSLSRSLRRNGSFESSNQRSTKSVRTAKSIRSLKSIRSIKMIRHINIKSICGRRKRKADDDPPLEIGFERELEAEVGKIMVASQPPGASESMHTDTLIENSEKDIKYMDERYARINELMEEIEANENDIKLGLGLGDEVCNNVRDVNHLLTVLFGCPTMDACTPMHDLEDKMQMLNAKVADLQVNHDNDSLQQKNEEPGTKDHSYASALLRSAQEEMYHLHGEQCSV